MAPKNTEILTFRQIAKIWDAMSPKTWLETDGMEALQFREYKPNDLVGLCPNPQHADTTPSFHIYTAEGHGYCYGCGYRPINPIEIIANVQRTSYHRVLQGLSARLPRLPFNVKEALTELDAQQLVQLTKTVIADICHDQLLKAAQEYLERTTVTPSMMQIEKVKDGPIDLTYEDLVDHKHLLEVNNEVSNDACGITDFSYARAAVTWLVETRKIPVDALHALPLGVFPPELALYLLILREYRPNNPAYSYLGGEFYNAVVVAEEAQRFLNSRGNKIASSCTGSVVFPLHRTPSHITALKTRHPTLAKENSFHIFSDQFDDGLGLFGLSFSPYIEHHNTQPRGRNHAIIVEGEFDALQPMVQASMSGTVVQPIYSAGGTGGAKALEEVLLHNDIRTAYLMGDSPLQGDSGKTVVQQWASHISRVTVNVFSDEGWAKLTPAGDLDDCYHTPAIPLHAVHEVLSKIQEYSTPLWQWAAENILPSMGELNPNNIRDLYTIAAEGGQFLLNEIDIQLYADKLMSVYTGISSNVLRREIHSKVASERGFILRFANAITDLYQPLAITTGMQGKELIVQSLRDKYMSRIRLDSDRSIAQELSPEAGSLSTFVAEHVGYPHFLTPPSETSAQIMQQQDRKLRFYAAEAVLELAKGMPEISTLKRIRNGYHFIPGDTVHPDREYLVNGGEFFLLDRKSPEDLPTYVPMNSLRHERILLDVTAGDRWYQDGALTPEMLHSARSIDLNSAYHQLCDLYDAGLRFKRHDVTVRFLSALTLTYPIMSCFDRQTLVALSGDSNAGKSSLMHILSGRNTGESDPTRLLLMSRKWDQYTVAGVIRSAECSTLLFCLDEFESDSKQRAGQVEGLSESVRQLVSGVASKVMAAKDGGTTELRYFLPIMFASISGVVKQQDINRLINVDMHKEEYRADPSSLIQKKFSPKQLQQLRLAVNFGAIQHTPMILNRYRDIKTKYAEINEILMSPVNYRYMSAFFALFSVMEQIGVNWRDFFQEYTGENKTSILRGATVTESDSVLSSILFNPVIDLGYEGITARPYCLAEILPDPQKRTMVNSSASGVYFDEEYKLLLLNLDQIMNKLVPHHTRMSHGLTPMTIRTLLERHTYALAPQKVAEMRLIDRARRHMGVGLSAQRVVVLQAEEWLKVPDDTEATSASTTSDPPDTSLEY